MGYWSVSGSRVRVARAVRTSGAMLALVLLFAPVSAFARGAGNHFVGLQLGLAFPQGSTNIFTLGLESFYRIFGDFGAGLFYQRYGIDASFSSGSGTATLSILTTYYGIEPQYVFTGSLDGFTAGVRLGMTSSARSASADEGNDSLVEIEDQSSQFFFAPKLAYDHPIGRFTVGTDVSYAMGLGANAPKALIIQFAGKFWF